MSPSCWFFMMTALSAKSLYSSGPVVSQQIVDFPPSLAIKSGC